MAFPTFRQLRHLVALADHGHFSRAAKAANVTQSTLSASIKELEEILEATLIDRSKRRVIFTSLGEATVERARLLLRAAEELVLAARTAGEPLSGALRLGVIPTISPFLLPRLLPPLRQAHPKLRLYIKEDLTTRLVDQLDHGKLDILLLALPCDCGTAETFVLFEDRFSVACRSDHPLATLGRVAADQLSTEPMLLLGDGHCLRGHALSVCDLAAHRRDDSFEVTSLHTLVQMVDNGLGITMLPQIAIDAGITAGTGLVVRPVTSDRASRHIGLAWRCGTPQRDEFLLLGRELAELTADLREMV